MTLSQNNKFTNWHLEQIKHAYYEYSNWNWWSWSKIKDLDKYGSKIEMCEMFTTFDTQN